VGSASPASATVLRGQGLTDPQYGSIFLPQMALAAVGATGAGFVLDRFGAKRVLALGLVLMALSQAALGAVVFAGQGWTYPLALLGTSLLGLGAGVSARSSAHGRYPPADPVRSGSALAAAGYSVGGFGAILGRNGLAAARTPA
jgi:MFS family permease